MKDRLWVGYARCDITPEQPVPLDGYGNNVMRTTDHVLDPLYVSCIAFRLGNKTVLLYTQDLLNTKWILLPEARKQITEATGVPSEDIFLCSTHTHSGPDVNGGTPGVEAFLKKYWTAVAEAGKMAIADLAPAQLYGASTVLEGMNFVRHYLMNDGTYAGSNFGSRASGIKCHAAANDPKMRLIKIVREEKKGILLMNWQAHPCFTGSSTKTDISADYIGAVRKRFEEETGMLFAFFQGPAGNQTTGSWIEAEHHGLDCAQYGDKLAQTAITLLPQMQKLDSSVLQTYRCFPEADVNHDDVEMLEVAQQVVNLWRETKDRDAGNLLARSKGLTSVYHATTVIARSQRPARMKMELNAVRVGDMAFVTCPYEMFAVNGKYIKDNSPFKNTLICTCTNGDFVYVPSKEAFDYGCYERSVAYFDRGTGELAAETFVQMLKKLEENL